MCLGKIQYGTILKINDAHKTEYNYGYNAKLVDRSEFIHDLRPISCNLVSAKELEVISCDDKLEVQWMLEKCGGNAKEGLVVIKQATNH